MSLSSSFDRVDGAVQICLFVCLLCFGRDWCTVSRLNFLLFILNLFTAQINYDISLQAHILGTLTSTSYRHIFHYNYKDFSATFEYLKLFYLMKIPQKVFCNFNQLFGTLTITNHRYWTWTARGCTGVYSVLHRFFKGRVWRNPRMNINNRVAAGLYTNRCVVCGGGIDQRAAGAPAGRARREARAGTCDVHLSPSSHLIYRVSPSNRCLYTLLLYVTHFCVIIMLRYISSRVFLTWMAVIDTVFNTQFGREL